MEIEETQDADALAILNGVEDDGDIQDNNEDTEVSLPSDNNSDVGSGDNKLYAGKYKNVDELKKGIKNIGSKLPEYVIDGMNDSALEKHYQELQSSFSKTGRKFAEESMDSKEDTKKTEPKGDLKQRFIEMEDYFKEHGEVSNEIYNKLNKAGIPDDVVDRYAERLEAEQIQFSRKVIDIAGGEQRFFEIKDWAEANIPQRELDAISKLPYDTMIIAMQGIQSRYEQATGRTKQPTRLEGRTGFVHSTSYKSQGDYLADVSDKRYGNDKRYTDAVEKKFNNSKF